MIPKYFKENELIFVQKILAWHTANTLGYESEQAAMEQAILLLVNFSRDLVYPQKVGQRMKDDQLSAEEADVWSEQAAFIAEHFVPEDGRAEVRAFFSREEARRKWEQGRQFDAINYQSYIKGEPKWTRAIQYIFDYEGELYGYYFIIETDAFQKRVDEVLYMAGHDSLTGLYNRHKLKTFLEELKSGPRSGESVFYVILDADHFKAVNDSYGHSAGDRALITLSERLEEVFYHKRNDMVFRLGGDEFLVLVLSTDEETLLGCIREMAKPTRVLLEDGRCFEITLSIGYGRDLASADAALYYVKDHGRAGYKKGC